jgi:hypothetical protein
VGLTNSLPKIELRFQKGNHANPTACAPRRTEKKSPVIADLSSYHDGALSGGRVENPLSSATSDCLTAGRLIYQLCRGANRGNAEQNRKGTGRNQVLKKNDMASLKNWAG